MPLPGYSEPHCPGICVSFLSPVLFLTVRPSQPVEGSSVTLTCNIRVPLGKLDVFLQFCFFRNGQVLWPGWSSSSELQLPTVWREDTGSYWCEGKTTAPRVTRSSRVQIQVQSECGGPAAGGRHWRGQEAVSPDTGVRAPAGMGGV